MKQKVMFAILVLSAMIIAACNLGAVPQVVTPIPTASETATSVYTQPLATADNFLTLIAPPSPTPFLPATPTSIPIGSLNVIAHWEGNRAIVQTEFQWTNKNRTSYITYRLLCDDNVAASGPIVEGMNPVACEPNVNFEYKIGDVTVTWGEKEGYTVSPSYTINIP